MNIALPEKYHQRDLKVISVFESSLSYNLQGNVDPQDPQTTLMLLDEGNIGIHKIL
jgi:hypothetical protein